MLFKEHGYSRLAQAESGEQVEYAPNPVKRSPVWKYISQLTTLCVVAIAAFYIGRSGRRELEGFGTELAWSKCPRPYKC